MTRILRLSLTILLMMTAAPGAFARPAYAIKERRPCAYCHINPNGGGQRNPRGLYYATHKHSFEGYDEVAVMGRSSSPLFHEAWKETLPAAARRMAVADTAGDGTLRLILLSEGATSGSRKLTVQKWDGKTWALEFAADAASGEDRLAAGRYAPGRPAVIVTADALWVWKGKTFARRPAPRSLSLLGTVVLRDGSERLLLHEGEGLKLYRVDLAATGGGWLSDPQDPPPSASTTFSEMKGRTEELKAVGLPNQLAGGGIVGLWDARRAGTLFLYAVHIRALADLKSEEVKGNTGGALKGSENIILKGREVYVIVLDPRAQNLRELWRSDKLEGGVLDIALNDPRSGGVRGLAVLTDQSADGKGHTLTFFQLD